MRADNGTLTVELSCTTSKTNITSDDLVVCYIFIEIDKTDVISFDSDIEIEIVK